MNVACGHNRYAKILAKLVDASRYLLDIVNAAKPPDLTDMHRSQEA